MFSLNSLLALSAVLGVWITIALLFRPRYFIPVSTAAAVLIIRPNFWGAELSVLGVAGIVVIAAIVNLGGPQRQRSSIVMSSMIRTPSFLMVAYFWAFIVAAQSGGTEPLFIATGALLSLAAVGGTLAICVSPERALGMLRGFVALSILVCTSYVVTLASWMLLGIGSTVYTEIPGGGFGVPVPVHFPFTTTMSTLQIFGMTFPRFVGFGREPGWMALWAGSALFLYRFTNWRSRWPRWTLLLGLLGTLSTAGFAVVVVALALEFMLHRGSSNLRTASRRIIGPIVMVLALFTSIATPFLGLGAKETQNALSYEERNAATFAGIDALMRDPFFGGQGSDAVASVNLVAAIAVFGLPWVFAICAAIVLPLWRHPARTSLLPFTFFVIGTLAAAQPAQDSIWVFCLVVIAVAAAGNASTQGVKYASDTASGRGSTSCAVPKESALLANE